MNMIDYLWILIQMIIGYNLILPIIFLFLYQFTKHTDQNKTSVEKNEADYGIIVTAFEQTHLLPAAVNSILELKYDRFLVYVVADNCDISNLHFKDERVIVLRPENTLASNIRSHFYAIERFKRDHDRLTIIDSDNLVHPQYLTELNKLFNRGFHAVQGIRKAKNLDTIYACLDAARDIYYHFYDGKILFGIGSSATLAGSGMAFTTKLYCKCLENISIAGAGFDKVLQYIIVKQDLRIAFAQNALVYDEKTSATDQLIKQRSRWINTWFKYFRYGFSLIANGVKHFSFNQFLFGLILLRPPVFIFLILSVTCLFISIWVNSIHVLIWLIAFLCFISAFILSMLKSHADRRIYQSLINIPRFIFYQLISLVRIRSAERRTIATKHIHNSDIKDIT